ncbi:MAG: LysM peptidoglycan-binding domain-containing protein [Anaerolineaceae bacterium]|nr:LysM peptidoglycan-binding domain-containing protein [Anaerolineaceae bacterium]
MQRKKTAQSVIASYRKRQQWGPFLIGGLAVLLVVIGLFILIIWLTGDGKPAIRLFKTKTPTPTMTSTITPTQPTYTPSMTFTVTETPLPSITPTASAPFEYVVQENDSCYAIAEKFGIDIVVLLAINNMNFDCMINPGQTIIVPDPNTQLPTATPIPSDLPSGTRITYTVVTGDYLGLIAAKFRSTEEAIIKANKLVSPYMLYPGQLLIIPVNIATMTPTKPPTRTFTAGPLSSATPTLTTTPTP